MSEYNKLTVQIPSEELNASYNRGTMGDFIKESRVNGLVKVVQHGMFTNARIAVEPENLLSGNYAFYDEGISVFVCIGLGYNAWANYFGIWGNEGFTGRRFSRLFLNANCDTITSTEHMEFNDEERIYNMFYHSFNDDGTFNRGYARNYAAMRQEPVAPIQDPGIIERITLSDSAADRPSMTSVSDAPTSSRVQGPRDIVGMSDSDINRLFFNPDASAPVPAPEEPADPAPISIEEEGITLPTLDSTVEAGEEDVVISFGDGYSWMSAAARRRYTDSSENVRNMLSNLERYSKPTLDDAFGVENWEVFLSSSIEPYMIIRFPEVVIKNTRNQSHLMRELFMKVELRSNVRRVQGKRLVVTEDEFNQSGYRHSHLNAANRGEDDETRNTIASKMDQYMRWDDFCLGETDTEDKVRALPIALRTRVPDELVILAGTMQFTSILKLLASHESIEGGPHYELETMFSHVLSAHPELQGERIIDSDTIIERSKEDAKAILAYMKENGQLINDFVSTDIVPDNGLGIKVNSTVHPTLYERRAIKAEMKYLSDSEGSLLKIEDLINPPGEDDFNFPTEREMVREAERANLTFKGQEYTFTVIKDMVVDYKTRGLISTEREPVDADAVLGLHKVHVEVMHHINTTINELISEKIKQKYDEQFKEELERQKQEAQSEAESRGISAQEIFDLGFPRAEEGVDGSQYKPKRHTAAVRRGHFNDFVHVPLGA